MVPAPLMSGPARRFIRPGFALHTACSGWRAVSCTERRPCWFARCRSSAAAATARAQTDPPPSDDATLSALALTDTDTGNAIGLDPSFARDVLAYAAEVATDVRTITMEAAANHSSATLKYMNAKEGALSDVDTDTDGFQVGLMVGTTVTKVQVEAENGAKQIYSASIMRQGPPFSLTVDTIAGDDVVNIREKAGGFTVRRRRGERGNGGRSGGVGDRGHRRRNTDRRPRTAPGSGR